MIKINEKAPNFTLLNEDGELVTLSAFLGQKVIVYFYPKDNTPGCTKQACSFRDNFSALTNLGYKVLAISRDNVKTHKGFSLKYALPFTLLADPKLEVITAYGMLKTKVMFGKTVRGTSRSTVIINEEGVITDIFRDVKAATSTAELAAYLQTK